MAVTQEQLLTKIKTWVPGWFFDNLGYQEALFQGISKALIAAQTDIDALRAQTFITTATEEYLELHGSERSVDRFPGESDESYSTRIRVATNSTLLISLKQLVDACLTSGVATAIENYDYGFFGDEFYLDDPESRLLERSKSLNFLTFLIPAQSEDVKERIVLALEGAKAFGITYDVLYE